MVSERVRQALLHPNELFRLKPCVFITFVIPFVIANCIHCRSLHYVCALLRLEQLSPNSARTGKSLVKSKCPWSCRSDLWLFPDIDVCRLLLDEIWSDRASALTVHSDKKAGQRKEHLRHLQKEHSRPLTYRGHMRKQKNENKKPIANKLSANVSGRQTVPSSKKMQRPHRPLMGSFNNYPRSTRADQPLEKPTAPRSETKHRSRTNDRSHCVRPAHDLQSATSVFKRPVSTPIYFTLNVKNTWEKTPTQKQALFLR